MTNIFLFLAFISLLLYHFWYARSTGKERETWIKALMSKDLTDFTQAKLMENPPESKPEVPPEFVETETASDDLFQKMIEHSADKPDEEYPEGNDA